MIMSLLERLLWMGLGFGIGLIVCNFELAMNRLAAALRRDRRDRKRGEGGMARLSPRAWWGALKKLQLREIAILVCVIAAFVSAYLAGSAKAKSDHVSGCSVKILGQLLEAQNQARISSNPARDAETLDKKALRDVLLASLQKPPPSQHEARQIVNSWLAAVQADVDAADAVGDTIDNYPLPTRKQLLACVD